MKLQEKALDLSWDLLDLRQVCGVSHAAERCQRGLLLGRGA